MPTCENEKLKSLKTILRNSVDGNGPEVLLSLSYNSCLPRLTVNVLQAKELRWPSNNFHIWQLDLPLVIINDSLWFLGLGPKKTTLLRTPLSKSVWAEPPRLSRWGACYRLKGNGKIKKRFKVKKSSVVRSSTCPQYSQSFHFKLQVLIVLKLVLIMVLIVIALILTVLSLTDWQYWQHWQYSQLFYFNLQEELLDTSSVNVSVFEVKSFLQQNIFRANSLSMCLFLKQIFLLRQRFDSGILIFRPSAQIWWQRTKCLAPVSWEDSCWLGNNLFFL